MKCGVEMVMDAPHFSREIALPHLVLYFIETTSIAGEEAYLFR